jgi:hypothetical protein
MTVAEKQKKLSANNVMLAQNERWVYDAGYEKGKADAGGGGGYDEGFADGVKSEHERFMGAYQDNGNPKNCDTAFAGAGWTTETFRPIHDIVPTSAYMMFRNNPMEVDLVEYLENLDVKLDFSQARNTQYIFQGASFTRLGVIDFSASTSTIPIDGVFMNDRNLVTIDKVVLKTGTKGEIGTGAFSGCISLENVTFEGKITATGLVMNNSTKLSRASIENIIGCLSTIATGQSITLSKTAVNKAFETSVGANDGSTSSKWLELIGTRSNWTISLA